MKKIILLAVMLLVFTTTGWAKNVVGNAVEVQISTDSGKILPFYHAGSSRSSIRVYAEALKGEQYSIRVRNLINRRIGIVVAVDGRNIISGKQSWLKNSERMYILEPYEDREYKGWRTGTDRINRFYFTDVADSYAAAFNDTSAMGVIAVAVYPEVFKYEPPASPSVITPEGGKSKTERKGAAQSYDKAMESAGTGYGNQEYSPSRIVAFNPESSPLEKIFIKYEWHNTLCAKGIIPCGTEVTPPNRLWDGFDFVPPPPNKRGK